MPQNDYTPKSVCSCKAFLSCICGLGEITMSAFWCFGAVCPTGKQNVKCYNLLTVCNGRFHPACNLLQLCRPSCVILIWNMSKIAWDLPRASQRTTITCTVVGDKTPEWNLIFIQDECRKWHKRRSSWKTRTHCKVSVNCSQCWECSPEDWYFCTLNVVFSSAALEGNNYIFWSKNVTEVFHWMKNPFRVMFHPNLMQEAKFCLHGMKFRLRVAEAKFTSETLEQQVQRLWRCDWSVVWPHPDRRWIKMEIFRFVSQLLCKIECKYSDHWCTCGRLPCVVKYYLLANRQYIVTKGSISGWDELSVWAITRKKAMLCLS